MNRIYIEWGADEEKELPQQTVINGVKHFKNTYGILPDKIYYNEKQKIDFGHIKVGETDILVIPNQTILINRYALFFPKDYEYAEIVKRRNNV